MSAVRRPGRSITTVMLLSAFAVLGLLAFGLVSGRFRAVPVLSGSMRPSLQPGDVAILTPKPASEVIKGDMLVYHIPIGDRALVVHRVVKVVEQGESPVVITKGDANEERDPWRARLEPGTAWTVASRVPVVGHVAVWAQQPWFGLTATAIVVGVFLLIAMRWIWRSPRDDSESVGAEPSVA